MNPDYGKTAEEYSLYRAGFPDELFNRLEAMGLTKAGTRLLDLGTGTGALARGFAKRGCDVVGLDISPDLIREAEALDAGAGVEVRYLTGTAEETGLPDEDFDIVTAAVCWHWFDGPRAAAEIRRVLRPGGHLLIVHFDWLSIPNNLVEASEQVIWQHVGPNRWKNKALRWLKGRLSGVSPLLAQLDGTGIHPDRLSTLAAAGYESLETFSFDTDIAYSHEAWRGRVRTHADVGASQTASRVARVDGDLQALLRERFSGEPLQVPHRVFVVIGRSPGGA